VFSHDAQFVSINAARYDATKHRALAVTGDAKETVAELEAAGWKADAAWTAKGKTAFKAWNDLSTRTRSPPTIPCPPMRRWWVGEPVGGPQRHDGDGGGRPSRRDGEGLEDQEPQHL
jgi:hypothetical protein